MKEASGSLPLKSLNAIGIWGSKKYFFEFVDIRDLMETDPKTMKDGSGSLHFEILQYNGGIKIFLILSDFVYLGFLL